MYDTKYDKQIEAFDRFLFPEKYGDPMPLPEPFPPIPSDAPTEFSRWRHWKGDTITVLRVARQTETGEFLVIYSHLGEVWARPLTMWADEARPGVVRFVRAPANEQPGKV